MLLGCGSVGFMGWIRGACCPFGDSMHVVQSGSSVFGDGRLGSHLVQAHPNRPLSNKSEPSITKHGRPKLGTTWAPSPNSYVGQGLTSCNSLRIFFVFQFISFLSKNSTHDNERCA